jgi:transposase
VVEHSLETREHAEELYVLDGYTYEQVARELNVGVRTVTTWSANNGWRERRRDYQKDRRDARRDLVRLRRDMLAHALETLDPRVVGAAVRVETVARKDDREKPGIPDSPTDRPRLFMETLEFIAGALKDADPEGLKVLAKNFDRLVEKFKAEQ